MYFENWSQRNTKKVFFKYIEGPNMRHFQDIFQTAKVARRTMCIFSSVSFWLLPAKIVCLFFFEETLDSAAVAGGTLCTEVLLSLRVAI